MSKRMILTEEQAIFSRQKRYMSESAILSEIDRARQKQRRTCEEAEKLKDNGAVDEARNLFEKADRIEERIKTLGHKLAAFRTEIFSFTTDRAVV